MPIDLKREEWEVGLVEISYPTGYRKRNRHSTLRLGKVKINFPVKHYDNMSDLAKQLSKHYKKLSRAVEEFYTQFNEALKPFIMPNEVTEEPPSSSYGANSAQLKDSIVSHFPVRT
jgi:hypothetical protein